MVSEFKALFNFFFLFFFLFQISRIWFLQAGIIFFLFTVCFSPGLQDNFEDGTLRNLMLFDIFLPLSSLLKKCLPFLYHTSSLMYRDGSSVIFFLWVHRGGIGSCDIRPPHPNDSVGIDLTPTPIPAANLHIHTRQVTTEMALYLIWQQPKRAKLFW